MHERLTSLPETSSSAASLPHPSAQPANHKPPPLRAAAAQVQLGVGAADLQALGQSCSPRYFLCATPAHKAAGLAASASVAATVPGSGDTRHLCQFVPATSD